MSKKKPGSHLHCTSLRDLGAGMSIEIQSWGHSGPGLGINVDWDSLATADFHVYSKLDLSVSPE